MKYTKSTLKNFISYYKPHRVLFYLDLLAAFLLSAIQLVYPYITTKAIDEYIPNGMLDQILISVGFLFVLYIIMAGLNHFMAYQGHIVGVRMETDMRRDFFNHLQKLSFSFFDKSRVGNLMSRAVNDLNQITELAHHGPEDLFISFVMFTGSFIILLNKEWRLALVLFVVVIPIMVWYSITQRRKLSASFKKVREETANINSQLENSISGVRVSKAYTNEDYESEKFAQGNSLFKQTKSRVYKAMARYQAGMGFLINFLNVVVLGLGGYFAYKEIITIGELTGFLLYMFLITQPVKRLTEFTQQFEQGMNGFIRFEEIIKIQPDILDGPRKLENVDGDILFKDVSFSYDESEKILEGINLTIPKGKTVALVGPSGGGKTTICHLIPRFYDVIGGEVMINDINVKKYTLNSLRKHIGLVQQDVFLFTGTIKDNIQYGKVDATFDEIIEAAKEANIHEFIQSLPDGYSTWIGEKGIRLSGGQKQRISIARAFLKNPPILILDEATSALDNETERSIQKALDKLSVGKTTIVIAHRLSTIKNADTIMVLSEKGLEQQGTHEKLYAQDGIYKNLYDAQFVFETNSSTSNKLNK